MDRRVLYSGIALMALGCAGDLKGEDAGGPSRGLVEVELTFTRIGQATRFSAQGHFARFEGTAARVEAVLGLADDEAVPLDGCRLVDSGAEIDQALQAPGRIELLDAGRLLVKGPRDGALLAPRHYPEVTPFVGGVVYGADEAATVGFEAGAAYRVIAEGGEEVGPFEGWVRAPAAFPGLTAGSYRRGEDLEVRWSGGEGGEAAVLSVAWNGRTGARELRCRVRDDGRFTVPREFLLAAPEGLPETSEIALVRRHRGPLWAPGAGSGTLMVALRELAPLAVATEPVTERAGLR